MLVLIYLLLQLNLVVTEVIWLPISGVVVIGINLLLGVYFKFQLPNILRQNFLFYLFVLYVILHSILFSYSPSVSLLKVFSLVCGLSAINAIYLACRKRPNIKLLKGFVFFILGLSLLSVFLPFGYAKNGEDLNGLFESPQGLGLILILILYYNIFSDNEKWKKMAVYVTVIGLIWLTNSRTALLGSILLVLLAHRRSLFALISYISLLTLTVISIQDVIVAKMQKGKSSSLVEAYFDSRGVLLDGMRSNIESRPMGIGWGIPSDLDESTIRYFFGVPYSWSTEKGNILFAVREELGLVGIVLFVVLTISILARTYKRDDGSFDLAVVVLVLNLSENFLFSFSGIGGLFLVLLTIIIAQNEIRDISLQ